MGNINKARSLYDSSLKTDPFQQTTKLLLQELENPFSVEESILDNESIPVCIYSYNKDKLLKMTLNILCKTDLGKSDVIVLLNGCTDKSKAAVEQIKTKYPDVPIECIEMPINIGDPAARNYLVNHVLHTRKSKYVAFLDDDVELPENWLKSLTTAIEESPDIGVVGYRVLCPGNKVIQYMYRNTSIVNDQMFRLSLATPYYSTDSGLYHFRRDVDSVMGCCHLIRTECFEKVPAFDICFSPSQLDDVASIWIYD